MPEGNSIHRFAREHTRDFGGRPVRVSSPQGRFTREARRLDGRVFQRAEARGKHLFHHWEGGLIVHVHLGMFGWFYRRGLSDMQPRPTVRMRLSTPDVTWDLIGPPTSELVTAREHERILARLGPDPLARRDGGGSVRAAPWRGHRKDDRRCAPRPAHRGGRGQHLPGRGALPDGNPSPAAGRVARSGGCRSDLEDAARPDAAGRAPGPHRDRRVGRARTGGEAIRCGCVLRLPAGALPALRRQDPPVPAHGTRDVRVSPMPAAAAGATRRVAR